MLKGLFSKKIGSGKGVYDLVVIGGGPGGFLPKIAYFMVFRLCGSDKSRPAGPQDGLRRGPRGPRRDLS